MPIPHLPSRISLTVQFILWSLAIIFVFAVTATLLFWKINRMEQISSEIVQTHYRVVDLSEGLIDQLLTAVEYKKRYQILENEDDRDQYLSELSAFQRDLNYYLKLSSVQSSLEKREEAVPPMAYAPHPSGGLSMSDQASDAWLKFFSTVRDDHRTRMAKRLQGLEAQGEEAVKLGILGLVVTSLIVATSSIVLIVRISRSTRELKKGLQRVGQEDGYEPIQVMTHDELGELSVMFNAMTARLKKEEEKRTDFISMLSHEIRTPLTSIRESLSLVQEELLGPVTEKQAHFLDVSKQEVERLTTLLNRLMAVSSLDSQMTSLTMEPHHIGQLLQNCLARVEPLARGNNVQLKLHDLSEGAVVLADEDNLQQVLLNLVGNAIKFSPYGTTVNVVAKNSSEQGFAIITVWDQGPGIPEEEQHYVFDTFYRGKSSRDQIDGTGLGLSISKRIVRAHGGDMWLEDTDGRQGCAFSFSLPKKKGSW